LSFDGQWVAFVTDPASLPIRAAAFQRRHDRIIGNSNGVVAGGAVDALGVVSAFGAISRGLPSSAIRAIQFTADGSLLWAEGSADGKREIKTWHAGSDRGRCGRRRRTMVLANGRDSSPRLA
jgi:hypothetical protein